MFITFGYLAIVATHVLPMKNHLPLIVLGGFHGVAGLIILVLTEVLVFTSQTGATFSLVGMRGALIGVGGLLLVLLRAGKSFLPHQTIFRILPIRLLLMTASFVLGYLAISANTLAEIAIEKYGPALIIFQTVPMKADNFARFGWHSRWNCLQFIYVQFRPALGRLHPH